METYLVKLEGRNEVDEFLMKRAERVIKIAMKREYPRILDNATEHSEVEKYSEDTFRVRVDPAFDDAFIHAIQKNMESICKFTCL